MKETALLAIVLMLGSVAAPATASAESDDRDEATGAGARQVAEHPGRDAVIDNIYWCNDRRLTDNGAVERLPAIAVDSGRAGYVSYYRGSQLYLKKVDRLGNELFAERQVASGEPYVQPCGQPTERTGMDCQDQLHILWNDSLTLNPTCQMFASNLSTPVQPVDLSPIAYAPRGVGLAVGGNGFAYIGHENGGSCRAEMAYLDNSTILHTGYLAGMYCKGVTIGVNMQDWPYIFYKNGTAPGLWMTIFSPQGQLIQSPTKIDTPVAGTGWDAPFPSVAFGSDGAVHMLQASRASGTKTLFYTKLGPDGTKLTGDIPVTSSSGDFGDICVDGKRNVFIVWGNATDGDLYYVHIEPGKENETLKPYQLTQTSGIDRDPQIVADREGSLHVVWVSDRDGNPEIYYLYGYTFGVELTMTPDEMAKIKYVHINQTRSANLTVHNTGGLNNTVFLSVDADFCGKPGGLGNNFTGEGYKIWIDENNERLDLAPQESRKVPVHVRGPLNGVPNEYINVIVNSTCLLGPEYYSSCEFRVYLEMDARIMLECLDPVHTAWAGIPAVYPLSITNVGESEASIYIAANGPADWNYSLNRSGLWLKPGESATVSLEVIPPSYALADDIGVVVVTAWRSDGSAIKATVKTTTIVGPFMWLEVKPDRTEATVEPGGIADYVLTVSNLGNLAAPVCILLEAKLEPTDWYVSLDVVSITLETGESGIAVLRVIPSQDAPARSNVTVRVLCYDSENRYSEECIITTFAGHVYELEPSVSPALLSVGPGGTATFSLDVSNLGNGPDVCTFESLAAPPMWDCAVLGTEGRIPMGAGIGIPYNGTGRFEVEVVAPAGAAAGVARFTGELSDCAGRSYELAFAVNVDQVCGVSIGSPAPQQAGDLRQRVEFSLGVRNTGNGNDTFHLTATGLPAGWREVEFRGADNVIGNRSVLTAGMTGSMNAIVEIPESTPLDRAWLNVTATSSGGPSTSMELWVNVRKPDLLVSRVELLSSVLMVDKPVMVRVGIRNDGDGPAESARVSYYRNGHLRTTEDLGTLLPGHERSVDFAWVPLDGRNDLRFTVDPLDSVCEKNETNNGATLQRRMHKESVSLLQDNTWMALAAAIPLVPAGLYIAARARRKLGK